MFILGMENDKNLFVENKNEELFYYLPTIKTPSFPFV
jgi:hypothetical protein